MELSAHVDVDAAWRQIRADLHRTVGESMFKIWIEPLEIESVVDNQVRIKAPPQAVAWLKGRFGRVLDAAVRTAFGDDARLTFAETAQASRGAADGQRTGATGEEPAPEPTPAGLHPRYRFDQFIIGDGNQLAHAAALAVAELPGQAYNPLFLHAAPGLGKTHLLHAIGNYVLAFGAVARVRYTTVESFTNHFIASLGARSLDRFKRAYRDVDILLIDDVQFLASKARTEEEFFHTFNALHDTGRQLVLTCDRLPGQLEGVAERLRERFEAGLVADIQPPDFMTRAAILRKRAALDGVPLEDPEVLDAIAARVTDNVRALEGALIRVVAYHSLTGQPIDRALTEHVLDTMQHPPAAASDWGAPAGGRLPGERGRQPTVDCVKELVATRYSLSVDELISASRAVRVAWPRQIAIHLARQLTGASLSALGAAFGGRNHATVLHACKRVSKRVAEDPQTAAEIQELASALRRPGS